MNAIFSSFKGKYSCIWCFWIVVLIWRIIFVNIHLIRNIHILQYGFLDICLALCIIINHYHYLFCCANCPQLGHEELQKGLKVSAVSDETCKGDLSSLEGFWENQPRDVFVTLLWKQFWASIGIKEEVWTLFKIAWGTDIHLCLLP